MTTQNVIAAPAVADPISAGWGNQVAGNLALPVWANLPLTANWVPYGGAFGVPAYWMDCFGRVYLRGLVKNTTGALQGINVIFATLPVGFRPLVQRIHPATCGVNNTPGGNGPCRLDIFAADGSLRIGAFMTGSFGATGAQDTGVPNGAHISLDGISFETLS